MMRRSLAGAAVVLALAGVAQAGGTIRGYVSLPAAGRVAFVDVDAGRVVKSLAVPLGAGPVIASIDGSRVLVANTRRGIVTETNGISGRRTRTFIGLGRPIELALIPRATIGLVRARYAIVLDARGSIVTLDLDRGRVVNRVRVVRPTLLALASGTLWVASAGSARLTQIDVSEPARARVLARPGIGGIAVALAPDPGGTADVDAALADGRVVQIDAISLRTRTIGRVRGRVSQLLAGYRGVLWAGEQNGRVLGVRTRDGRVVSAMHVPAGSRLAIVGGWLAVTHGASLRMLALGTQRHGTTTMLPGSAGAFAYAVLP
jgi:DNA-binding beta-propeller fold protein YncE